MSYKRLLAAAPARYRVDRLVGADVRHVNTVHIDGTEFLAAYVLPSSTMTEADWGAAVSAHDPTPDPPRVDPLDDLIEAIEAATSFDDLKSKTTGVKGRKAK